MTTHPPSAPDAALQDAFASALFEVQGRSPTVLKVGEQPGEVAAWLDSAETRSACIVTAWNPFSRATDVLANEQRQGELIARVEAAGLRWLAAQGRDPGGVWPPEPSLCVLDAPLPLIDQWLLDFEQYAVVTVDLAMGCRLRWHPGVRLES